jgi:lipopolysaccharide/colanic/teichoic acid biosynthesis glycosyltransferase
VGLLVCAPALAAVAIVIRLESRGPVLYRSRRVGRHGREFDMLKFRKMQTGVAGPRLTDHDDARFTRIGAVLSRTKLDELPQLWNVLRGDMSIVGPRPEDPAYVELYRGEFDPVLQVRPGITGLSQLAFAKENEILARPELRGSYVDRLLPAKLAIDRLYVERGSLLLDLRIIAWTFVALVLRIDVSVNRQTGRLRVRRSRADAATVASPERA